MILLLVMVLFQLLYMEKSNILKYGEAVNIFVVPPNHVFRHYALI